MKNIIIYIGFMFLSIISVGQNLISNPSFETPRVLGDCPDGVAQVDKLESWESRHVETSNPYIGSPSGYHNHSPDWMKVGCFNQDGGAGEVSIPHTGSGAVYCGTDELIQQNIQTLNEGLYIFSAYVKIYEANPNFNYYFRLRYSKSQMKYVSENSFLDWQNCDETYRKLKGNEIEEILIPIQTNSTYLGQWQYLERDKIAIYGFYYDWIGFDMVVHDQNGNERNCEFGGIHVDDVSLTKECCGDYILYQSFSNLPTFTQRRQYIRAGENVGAPNSGIGPVIVQQGQDVYFRAGQFIDLQPGFIINGTFTAEIAPCGNEPDASHTSQIDLDYVNQGAILDCGNTYSPPNSIGFGTNAAFYSKGGAWYRIQLFNGLGIKVYDKIDNINSLITMYWNGSSTFTSDLSDVMTAQLFIYNCDDMILENYTITYEYNSNCRPWYKREYIVSSDTVGEEMKINIELFPNPTTDIINVKTPIDLSNVRYRIIDQSLRIVDENLLQNNTVDFSALGAGTYTINFYKDQFVKAFKIVKL